MIRRQYELPRLYAMTKPNRTGSVDYLALPAASAFLASAVCARILVLVFHDIWCAGREARRIIPYRQLASPASSAPRPPYRGPSHSRSCCLPFSNKGRTSETSPQVSLSFSFMVIFAERILLAAGRSIPFPFCRGAFGCGATVPVDTGRVGHRHPWPTRRASR